MSIEQRLEGIESVLKRLVSVMEERGLVLSSSDQAISNGWTEAQNNAACRRAIELTSDGDTEALNRFFQAGGKIPVGKDLFPEVRLVRSGRPSIRRKTYQGTIIREEKSA